MTEVFDFIVIGGGFYGCCLAIQLASSPPPGCAGRVCLVEQAPSLMQRASYTNQARIHNGYHYPRSLTTALRSRVNLPRFVADWPQAVVENFTKIYAIARRNSKVTARQFHRFCLKIGASIQPADAATHALFNPDLIAAVFLVQEYAFNAALLAQWAADRLAYHRVRLLLNTKATRLLPGKPLQLELTDTNADTHVIEGRALFNCSYSAINQLPGAPRTVRRLKHELTEIALVHLPSELVGLGITVMDGPFFSVLPFPAQQGMTSLTHVRYTPHFSWMDEAGCDPEDRLRQHPRKTHFPWMIRDAARYLPSLSKCHYQESLFEVKTVLEQNEIDDGRPILFEHYPSVPGYFTVLGGKMDNIYDILEGVYHAL